MKGDLGVVVEARKRINRSACEKKCEGDGHSLAQLLRGGAVEMIARGTSSDQDCPVHCALGVLMADDEVARKEARKQAKKERQKLEKTAKKEAAAKAKQEADAAAAVAAEEEVARKTLEREQQAKERVEREAAEVVEAVTAAEEANVLAAEKDGEFTSDESRSQMAKRHESEMNELRKRMNLMLRVAKRDMDQSKRAEMEVVIIKLEADIEKRHANETDFLGDEVEEEAVDPMELQRLKDEEDKKRKMAKKMRKQNKKKDEEKERERQIEEDRANAVSMRDVELGVINKQLEGLVLSVKEIPSDGNCLFRAVIDQLDSLSLRSLVSDQGANHATIRRLAAQNMRANPDTYSPYLDEEDMVAGFDNYCTKMQTTPAWGGQLELQAIARALECELWVHSADAPVVKMGQEFAQKERPPLQVSFHKHYFALGEHYNSVVKKK
jgi:OTU domain-containing protein 6